MQVVAQNRRGFFDYELSDRFEAGIALTGAEIKAIRAGKVQIAGSYVKLFDQECFWVGGIIQSGHEEQRTRKLLLRKREINALIGKTRQKGFSLIPTRLYLKRNRAKLEFALGKGRKQHDKREAIRAKELNRETRNATL